MCGKVFSTSPSYSGRPAPPEPSAAWQLEHAPEKILAPSPSGPCTTSGSGVSERTYMKAHSGSRHRAIIAQTGTFLRFLYASTYGGSGFGGGGAAGAARRAAFGAAAGVTAVPGAPA